MKLGIVIPLKSKATSRNWRVTCRSFQDTLNSVESQTSSSYAAIVVGHDKPDFLEKSVYRTQFHELEYPPPNPQSSSFRPKDYIIDKNRKIVRGMQLLQGHEIDYWFELDADDLIHKSFVESLSNLDCKSGCILDGGYVLYKAEGRIIPTSDLSSICGSTSVLSNSRFEIPDTLTEEALRSVPWCRYSHRYMTQYFEEELGGHFLRVTDRLIAYTMGHGDNLSDRWRRKPVQKVKAWLKKYLLGRVLNPELRAAFSLS